MQTKQITLQDIYEEIKKIEVALQKKGIIENDLSIFMKEIQKEKMAEIWDNEYDSVWETV